MQQTMYIRNTVAGSARVPAPWRCQHSSRLTTAGADDGEVRLVDTRVGVGKTVAVHAQHSDFVSDFAHVERRRALLATSGDGTLSVMDLRSGKVPL